MTSELVVDVQPKEVSIALLEDKSLVELQSEGRNISFSVGNMYLGRIKKLMPGLNACFVDVGYEKDAFLHYLDLGPQFNSLEKFVKQTLSDKKKLTSISKATLLPDLDKDGTVSNTLKVGQEVVVQIVKEPISTKGPRLTSEISFAGRYLVLIPFNDKVSVSQKIKSSEERARLKQLLMSIKPKNFGVIVRTVAEGKRVAELDGELKVLVKHWEDAMVKVQKATKYPTLIYEETSRAVGLLRDLFNPSFENIHVNDEAVYNEIKDYVSLIAPDRANIVKLYKGQLPIYDNFGITKQIKSSFGKTISYKSGAYLIIEHTEALHVIRNIQNADYRKSLYKNGITTGTCIDGQIITLDAVRRYCGETTYRCFCEAVRSRTPFHSGRFDFRGYDGSLWVEPCDKDDGYHRVGDLAAGFSKEYRGCGNGYYYLLINEQTFIGCDID